MPGPLTASTVPAQTADVELYVEVQHFYARQMQLLDTRRCAEWAATFTEDGVFAANGLPAPAEGRAAIGAAAQAAQDRLAEQGLVHRHWLGMLAVERVDDTTVRARSYAVVLQVPLGGEPALHRSTVCEDTLVRGEDGDLLVLDRRVTRDDLA
ncbi:nuclear transport factor 2 family protein [Streptomyces sp. NPDC023838]|uniref:nuclear transport factor 2 family protein n=1 Tax=Streptomyces sp. NPDC023838 TaxID=3154325 RepID=UPI0033D284FA